MADKIELDIVTPERRVLSREVDSVILPGELGYLGVLPGHAPLLTRLMVGELTFEADGKTQIMAVCGGYAEVLGHRVRVLADTCELSHEIDLARAERSRERAEQELARKDLSGRESELAEFRLKKALLRIQVHGRRAS
jgi:F-type H+-transporting ATPase subunit epsilon